MKIKLDFSYNEEYLPTKRHKIPKIREINDEIEVIIPEVTKDDVELAFTVKEYSTDQNGKFRKFSRNYYAYDGFLFIRVFAKNLSANGTGYVGKQNLKTHIKYLAHSIYIFGKYRTRDICIEKIQKNVSDFIIIDNKVFVKINEPRYCINTFGLGFNHGGSCISIENNYNSNISKDRYFNALERNEVIEEFRKVAIGRGDTDSVKDAEDKCLIIVHNEKFVNCCPQKEHGEGDPFINGLERLVKDCNSMDEAGALVVAKAISEMQ